MPKIGECWCWTGHLDEYGYAKINLGDKRPGVHRSAYETWIGPIPDGHEVDHLCFVRHCFRPDHLEAVTPEENQRRADKSRNGAKQRAKTRCPRGHAYDDANTMWEQRNGKWGRRCRTCKNERRRR